jgi:hypothetical protein
MKKWYTSKTIIFAICSCLFSVAAIYMNPSIEMVGALTSSLISIYGRITATELIK